MFKKFTLAMMAMLAFVAISCEKTPSTGNEDGHGLTGEKLSDITYQLNVYSFADSDGDGWGDIKGITQHLDYLEELGVSALWLSPVQTSASYHGYDITDYNSINPRLGSEADFKDLIDKAGQRGIDIYMDYVLNHSGRGEWFNTAISSTNNPYRSYYVFSSNPSSDVSSGKVDNFGGGTTAGMGNWYALSSAEGRLHFKLDWSAKTITVTETTDNVQASNASASYWIYYGDAKLAGLYQTGASTYEITIDFASTWGFLVRTSTTSWDNGTKWGGNGTALTFGTPYTINNSSTAADITFNGGSYYFASFDKSMPDLNYGPYAKAYESAAFKALAASADKWINMGVKGLRLDAVLWIYQNQTAANVSFLSQWYDRINATYKANGGEGDIYMVGEAWADNAESMAPYYKGLPSNFNFYYWWTLKDRINKGKGDDFARTVQYFRNLFKIQRENFIDAIKMSNHDEDRAAQDLGRDLNKEKLAAAVLLTSPGKPFIYQGEELGYWGSKSGGDEYVRAPIKWTKGGSTPNSALNGKVDRSMLSADISVEAQQANAASLLNVYKKFAAARNSCRALAHGEITPVTSNNNAIGLWTMFYDGQTVLVAHNFGGSTASCNVTGYKFSDELVSNGVVTPSGSGLTMGAYSSAVFVQ